MILDGLKGLADEYDDMRQQLAALQPDLLLRPTGPTKPTLHNGDSAAVEDQVPTERTNELKVPRSSQRKHSKTSNRSTSDDSQKGSFTGLERSPNSFYEKPEFGMTLRRCWNNNANNRPSVQEINSFNVENMRPSRQAVRTDSSATGGNTDLDSAEGGPSCIIMTPGNSKRVAWDFVGMMLLGYDILVIPLGVFDPEHTWFFATMDWITLLFWTGDMVMSCLTSYVHEGRLVYSPRLIFINYLKSWFILDLVVNLPDWIAIFLEWAGKSSEGGSGGAPVMDMAFLRSLRVIRSVRLLRLVKLKRILAMLKDRIASEVVFIALSIFKLLSMLILMNHLIACAWYAVGGIEASPNNWRFRYDMTPQEASLVMRYATSLHWALTQFTPANSGVQPQNALERWFAIQVLIIGLVSSSSFISSITGSMAQLRNMDADRSKQFWLLRRYLKQKEVPLELSFKILRYTDFIATTKQEGIDEKRITLLDSLSDELRNQLKFVISYRCIKSHGLFAKLSKSHKDILFAMAGSVLSEKLLAAEDSLFSVIDEPTSMYYIRAGSLKYTLIRRNTQIADEEVVLPRISASPADGSSTGFLLESDQYLCEVVLWADWVHMGKAKALAETNIINVDAQAFSELTRKDRVLMEWLCRYAREFVNYMFLEAAELVEIIIFPGTEEADL